MRAGFRPGLAAALALAAMGCAAPKPRPVALGAEACRHCHMTIADPRFAAELVTSKGMIYAFDDVGCLAAFVREGTVPPGAVHSLWVYDYLRPDSLLDARRAVYLVVDTLQTPMSSHVAALRPGAAADSLRVRMGGMLVDWEHIPANGHPAGAHRG